VTKLSRLKCFIEVDDNARGVAAEEDDHDGHQHAGHGVLPPDKLSQVRVFTRENSYRFRVAQYLTICRRAFCSSSAIELNDVKMIVKNEYLRTSPSS
jgi:hypothetical protein